MHKLKVALMPIIGFILALCFVFTLFYVDERRAENAQALTDSSENQKEERYYASYDTEQVIRVLGKNEYSTPEEFGTYDKSFYPSINNVLKYSDISSAETIDQLKETHLGKILTEEIEILKNLNDDIAQNNLRKHKSADGQFFGTIDDDAERIEKKIGINYMVSSRHSLGVFAPAGEVLTIKVDPEIIDQTKNNRDEDKLSIIIGYPFLENNVSVFDDYTNGLNRNADIESITCENEQGDTVRPSDPAHLLTNIIDGNSNSWFSVQTRSGMPHYYIFKFRDEVSLTNVSLSIYNSETYRMKKFQFYISKTENRDDFELILTRETSSGNYFYDEHFEPYTGRYFIVKVLEGSDSGWSNFRDMNFNQSIDSNEKTNTYGSKESQFEYDGEWNSVNGTYINGSAKHSTNGEFTFVLEGSDILIYSKNAQSKIYIDGQEYTIKESTATNAPSFFLQGLENKKHSVKIVADSMIFDAVKTTGQIFEQDDLRQIQLDINAQIYNGLNLAPVIKHNGEILVENVDYELLSCTENKNAGNANFVIKGIGLYKGQFNSTFEIIPIKLSSDNVIVENLEDKVYTTPPEIILKTIVNGEEITLVKDVDYTVKVSNSRINITYKGNFSGTQVVNFKSPSNNLGLILGLCGAGVAVMVGIAALLFILKRKKIQKKWSKDEKV